MKHDYSDMVSLRERIKRAGWVSFIIAGSDVTDNKKPDVVAFKNGHVLFFKVVKLKGGSSNKNVREESRMLSTVVSNAAMMNSNFNAYFAITYENRDVWHIQNYSARNLNGKMNYRKLGQVLTKA